jgi:hypothetical protein
MAVVAKGAVSPLVAGPAGGGGEALVVGVVAFLVVDGAGADVVVVGASLDDVIDAVSVVVVVSGPLAAGSLSPEAHPPATMARRKKPERRRRRTKSRLPTTPPVLAHPASRPAGGPNLDS